ncbi:MAG: FAD binding domain-containing protein [Spirochaetaceae bacterium]
MPTTKMHITNVFRPSSLGELLKIYQEYPDALLVAGASALGRELNSPEFELPKKVIHLAGVPELKKISRSERYLEIGAGVPVDRILKVGKHVLPKALDHSLRKIGHPAIHNVATLGGNVCHAPRRLNSYGILTLLDTRAELRHAGGSRWIPIPRLFSKTGTPSLEPGELITRFRIPFVNWNLQFFQKVGDPFISPKRSLTFSALTEVRKGEITDFRIAVTFLGKSILRDFNLEALITGKKVPLTEKHRGEARELLRASLKDLPGEVTLFQKQRALRLFQWYLSALHEPESELAT